MSARKPFIAGNWKMFDIPEGALMEDSAYQPRKDVDVVVFPMFLDLEACAESGIWTGGQYGHPEPHGAHTGDVSLQMLRDRGCRYVLCGHSERRKDHHETDAMVAEQTAAACALGLLPIVCVGETLEEREAGKEKDVVQRQINAILTLITASAHRSALTFAYEPVWAIGTGKTATPEQAQEMHAFIRSQLPAEFRNTMRILYGGSVKAENAKSLLAQPDIDGALVGGASLKQDEFRAITIAAIQ